MALTHSEKTEIGSAPANFSLPGVDGRTWSLGDFKGKKGLLVAFICNHCPYVVAIQGRLAALAKEYQSKGIGFVGINSNDSVRYPDDGFEAMKARAKEVGYSFPYLHDETQAVAHAYGAVCTPDFFLFRADSKTGELGLCYRGRLDDNWKNESEVKSKDLARAMEQIVAGDPIGFEPVSSMGCSIKWKPTPT